MKTRFLTLLVMAACFAVAPVVQFGCKQTMTLEAGGAYTDPVLAQTDQSILDASRAMREYIAWTKANSVFLAKWPQVAQLATRIEAQEKGWIKDAYIARDAYAAASVAYRKAIADGVAGAIPPSRVKVDAMIAVLTSVVTEVLAYRQAHKP